MLGVLVHVVADAVNNLAVIILSLVIWLTSSPKRFYADPGISLFISILIMISSIPLVKKSGSILMETAPRGVLLGDVKHDLERVGALFCSLSLIDGQYPVGLSTSRDTECQLTVSELSCETDHRRFPVSIQCTSCISGD
jgi:hypothetical protein